MRRSVLIVLLGLGTVLGYGSGLHSMARHARDRHAAMEHHVARVCLDAARGGSEGHGAPGPGGGPWSGPGGGAGDGPGESR